MYPLTPTEKSGQSSFLVLEIKGCEPQSQWEMDPCSRCRAVLSCGSVVSALGAGSKSRGTGPTLAALASESEPSLYKGGNVASRREGFT